MIKFLRLDLQHQSIQDDISSALERVVNSGWYILGKEVEGFEHDFSAYIGTKFGIGVNSGTDALYLSLLALGIGEGDEVITVSNSAIPTAAAIAAAGAKPVFVDIHPESYTMDPEKVESKITSHTKVLMPVHLYGQSCDMGPLMTIARDHDLFVVEDCAQSHGALYKNKKTGTFGDLACFSFYPTKNLGAYGDGGMVLTDHQELSEKLHLLRNYGQYKRYYAKEVGINSRLDEIQAAILQVKLPHLNTWNQRRREIARLYNKTLKTVSVPHEMSYGEHVYHLYVIRSEQRDALREYLLNEGVKTEIHYPVPLHLQEAYQYLGYHTGDYPVTEHYAREILSLPMYPELCNNEIMHIADLINNGP